MNAIFQILAGSWFVISSNFPMWLKGDKTDPQFHYTVTQRKGITVLDDKVTYVKNGKQKSINGYDKLVSDKMFEWRGYGLLGIAKSNWQVRLMDENHQWAVIYFSKTLFTPEGVDIISRRKDLSNETIEKIKQLIKADALLKDHVDELRKL